MILILYVLKILGLAIATEALTEIGTSSDIIAPWQKRWRLWTYPPNIPPPENPTISQKFKIFVNSLWSCGYCFSVWVAGFFAFFGVYPSDIPAWMYVPWWIINWMLIHRLSNFTHILFELVKRGRVRTYDVILRISESESDESESDLVIEGEDESRAKYANAPDDIQA